MDGGRTQHDVWEAARGGRDAAERASRKAAEAEGETRRKLKSMQREYDKLKLLWDEQREELKRARRALDAGSGGA